MVGRDGDPGIVAAGGVDENGGRAELRFEPLMRLGETATRNGVRGKERSLAALRLDRFRARLAAFFVAAEHGDFGAGSSEAFRQRAAQYASRADDNGGFVS